VTDLSKDEINFRRLLLIAHDGGARTPLGDRESVARRLSEMMPRVSIAPAGTTPSAAEGEVGAHLVGDPVMAIELTLQQKSLDDLRPSLERVADSGRWQLLDVDRAELLFPRQATVPTIAADKRTLRWSIAALVALIGLAGSAWWILIRALLPSFSRIP